jgi:hypothetical protein
VLVHHVAIGRVHRLSTHTAFAAVCSAGGHRYSPSRWPKPRGRVGGWQGRESNGRRAVSGLRPVRRVLALAAPVGRDPTYIGFRA